MVFNYELLLYTQTFTSCTVLNSLFSSFVLVEYHPVSVNNVIWNIARSLHYLQHIQHKLLHVFSHINIQVHEFIIIRIYYYHFTKVKIDITLLYPLLSKIFNT